MALALTDDNLDPTAEIDDDGDNDTPAEAPAQSATKNTMLYIIIGVLVALLTIGGVLFFFLSGSPKASGVLNPEELAQKKREELASIVYFEMPDLLVNLHDPTGKYGGLLKLSIYLELSSEIDKAAIEHLKPRIVDQFQLYLRGLKTKDIAGSTGLQRLREELLSLANTATEPIVVRSVLFREMLVQ